MDNEFPAAVPVQPSDSFAAPGTKAKHEHGVIYQGEFETPWDGTAVAVRLHARALAAQGVPLLLRSFSNMVIDADGIAEPVHFVGIPNEVTKEIGDLIDVSVGLAAPNIKHLVVRSSEYLRQVIVPRSAIAADDNIDVLIKMRNSIYSNTILYTVWERDRVDPEIVKHLARVAEVWVPCRQNQDMLLANGVTNVHVVPHPFDPQSDILKLTRRAPHTDGWKRFYSIGRWEPRKGFYDLIGAFLCAFRPGDKAMLTIKYSGGNWEGYPTPEEALRQWVTTHDVRGWTPENVTQHVTLIGGKLPRSRIVELHYRNNIYVSASHGEAFALPAFEGKLTGNALVHVPWGGTADFADEHDTELDYTMGPVHPSYRWETNARWADYPRSELEAALLRVKVPTRFVAPEHIHKRFSLDAVGKLMLQRVNAVLESAGSKVRYGQ